MHLAPTDPWNGVQSAPECELHNENEAILTPLPDW
jgi:hypothetical protein